MHPPTTRTSSRAPWLGAILIGVLAGVASAQKHAPESIQMRYHHDTGVVENTLSGRQVIASFPIYVEGATALRLFFEEVQLSGDETLGTESILRVTSWKDGLVQELNPRQAREWVDSTCYLNGDTIQVEIVAWPHTGPNRLVTESILAEIQPSPPETICGSDDRILSYDQRVARLSNGCTTWIIDDCNHCMITAGHCAPSGSSIAEFNVPLSSSGGSLNHPGPQDQYSVQSTSIQYTYGGIGNDWCYYGLYPNSITGLTPAQAQGSWFTLRSSPPAYSSSHTIRITGHGTDSTPSTHNQVQQTNSGPYYSFSGTTVRYTVDTTGGSSGSPVIWDDTGEAIGVHTHGGCSTSQPYGANYGTGSNHSGWHAALASPKGLCANPCGAFIYCTAKLNSVLCYPAISFTGGPSASGGPGSFDVDASNIVAGKNGLLFYGLAPAATPFQGGWLCVQPPIKRTSVQNSGGTGGCTGTYQYDFGARISSGVDPQLVAGATVALQYWYRDPASMPYKTGLSDAVQGVIQP